jgi:autotransporter-associated beta strand protein
MSGASQNLAISAAMALSSTQNWSVASGRTLSITGGVSGSGSGLSIAGNGKVVFGSLASYTGDTTISAGSTLQIALDNAVPGGPGYGYIAVNGMLDLNGRSQVLNGLSGNGLVDSTAAGSISLILSNSTSTAYSGSIRNTAGTLSVVKNGPGNITLGGTNTYSGTTSVSGGSLLINGLLSSAGGAVSVSSTATLGGTGTIARIVTVASGGTLSPGASVGTLTVVSNVTFSSGAKLSVTLDDAAPQYCSTLAASNTLTISSATLQIVTNGVPSRPVYVIAEYGTLVGSFAVTNGLPAGYYIDYAYNSGKTVAVVSAAADSDGDGIPNGWEIARGLNPYNSGDANIDTDTDKLTSRQEYWSGTDPQDSNSFFRIDSLSFEGSNLVLRWRHAAVDPVIPPISIQSRTNMVTGSWTNLGQKAPVNGSNSWDIPVPVGAYLRLCVTNMP